MASGDKQSRRIFLANAGKLAAGAAAGAAGLSLVAGSQGTAAAAADVPEWPWPYKKLDPEKVYWRGVDGYYKNACAQGAFSALIGELGYPFTTVPVGMLKFGEGGVSGWGSHCGALIGSSAAIGLVHKDSAVYGKLINELTLWYTEELGSGSPLCHISVTEWAKRNGVKVDSQERKDRCARLTGEVAKKAALLLNAQADGQFTPAIGPRQAVVDCLSCHGKMGMENVRNSVLQDCTPCHGTDPHGNRRQ
ncbi:MAG: C-GCAxxG-C-C family protein [Chloroflexi bacterium]|nr:C-GCAxxG-C-C family protein [Chloroflexota bacterium]